MPFSDKPEQTLKAALRLLRHKPGWRAAWMTAEHPHALVTWVHRRRCYVLVIHQFDHKLVWARAFLPHELPYETWEEHREYCMSFLKRVVAIAKAPVDRSVHQMGKLFEPYPALLEYLTATSWDGAGKDPRETCTMTLYAEGGVWKWCLRDRDEDATLWGTGDTPEGALEVLDGQLRLDPPPWRKSKPWKGGRRRN